MQRIIIPTEKTYTIELPDEFIGKRVRVSVEIDYKDLFKKDELSLTQDADNNLLETWLNKFTTNSKGYKFDREDANDCE
jgi:hypothetical protein